MMMEHNSDKREVCCEVMEHCDLTIQRCGSKMERHTVAMSTRDGTMEHCDDGVGACHVTVEHCDCAM